MRIQVPVTVPAAPNGKAPSSELNLSVSIDPTDNVVVQLKEAIQAATGLSPVQQRLHLEGGVDRFSLPASVRVEHRPQRVPEGSIEVTTLNEQTHMRLMLPVAPDDSVLDVLFLVAEAWQQPVQVLRLFVLSPRSVTVQPLDVHADTSLQHLGVNPRTDIIRVKFVYPSTEPGHGEIHRTHPTLRVRFDPQVGTLYDNFARAAEEFGGNRFLGTRPFLVKGRKRTRVIRGDYTWQSYAEVASRAADVAAGLVGELGLEAGDRVGIMSQNRTEWLLTDLACARQGLVSVPLYDTLGPTAVEFIMNHARCRVVVLTVDMLEHLTAEVRAKCPTLETVVVMDDNLSPTQAEQVEQGHGAAFERRFSEVERLGKESGGCAPNPPQPDDVYTICYTSGTTGNPKGVVLTHANMIAAVSGVMDRLPSKYSALDGLTMLSYLPSAHIYERMMDACMIAKGYALGFFQGDTTKLVEDVEALKPDIFPGVPRVWQRVYGKIRAQVDESNVIRRSLFNYAFNSRLSRLQHGEFDKLEVPEDADPSLVGRSFTDNLVLAKVAAKFGGNLKLVTSGAAPMSGEVAEFMKVCFLAEYGEGYGLSETCAGCTTIGGTDRVYGHVGTPISCCEVKLVSVPAMDYNVTDKPYPRGEIWIRGANVFRGYYEQPEKTAECLTEDGWFMTGDVGLWRADGNLQIIDRKKNIFKLSQGEYIRPEYIEEMYKSDKFVGHIFVYGNSNANFLVAVVVPDFEVLVPWARAHNIADTSPEALTRNPKVRAAVKASMDATAAHAKLRGFEVVKQIHLSPDEFCVENGLLTPTFKLKRFVCRKHFQKEIDAMYAPQSKL